MVDVGWAYSPAPGDVRRLRRLPLLAREGDRVRHRLQPDIHSSAARAGSILVDFNTPVMTYEPTWHAVRVGVEGKL